MEEYNGQSEASCGSVAVCFGMGCEHRQLDNTLGRPSRRFPGFGESAELTNLVHCPRRTGRFAESPSHWAREENAQANPIKVEEEKPERERGYYLHPEVHGQPEEKGIEWARRPELMRQLKKQREKAQREQAQTPNP